VVLVELIKTKTLIIWLSLVLLDWLELSFGTFARVWWQVTLCDPIWQVTLHSSVSGSIFY